MMRAVHLVAKGSDASFHSSAQLGLLQSLIFPIGVRVQLAQR